MKLIFSIAMLLSLLGCCDCTTPKTPRKTTVWEVYIDGEWKELDGDISLYQQDLSERGYPYREKESK